MGYVIASYAISIIAVFMFAKAYFNEPAYRFSDEKQQLVSEIEPALPVFMTDKSHYYFYSIIFIIITEVIFFITTGLLSSLTPKELEILGINGGPVLNPLLAAGIVIGVIKLNKIDKISKSNRLKWIRPFIDMFKDNLHITAKIPSKGQEIYSCLQDQDLDIHSDAVKHHVEATLTNPRYIDAGEQERKDLELTDFSNNRLTITSKWARLSYLITILENWNDEPRFSKSLRHATLRWPHIHGQYRELVPRIIDYRNTTLSEEEDAALNNEVELLLLQTYRLMSCLMFMSCNNQNQGCDIMQSIGFNVFPEQSINISFNKIVKVACFICFAIIIGAIVAGLLSYFVGTRQWLPTASELKVNTMITWVMYGVPMHLVPVIAILLIKKALASTTIWPVTRSQLHNNPYEDTPWGIYVFVSLFAFVLAGLSILGIAYVTKGAEVLNPTTIKIIYAYCLGTLVTGIFMCHRIDDPFDPNTKEKWLIKIRGAALQGFLTMLAMAISFAYAENGGSLDFSTLANAEKAKLVSYMTVSFFIGASVFLSTHIKLQETSDRQVAPSPSVAQTPVG